MRVLICGIAGAIARRLAGELLAKGHSVAGIDVRPWKNPPAGLELHTVDLRKRAAEDVFRKFRPNAVVHMATVTSLVVSGEERYRINLGGTQAVFEHCRAYSVEHCVFVGRHTFYGAGADTALYHTESEPPHALGKFPELADLVAADLFAGNALWRLPQLTTSVLRICYSLGPSGQGTLGSFLRSRAVPMVFGFDPLFQFLHEDDIAQALLLTLEKRPRGIFNVCGPQPLPLTLCARESGRLAVPLPELVLQYVLGRFGFPTLTSGAIQHLKFPCVIDGSVFRQATGFDHRYDELETLRDFARAFPAGGTA